MKILLDKSLQPAMSDIRVQWNISEGEQGAKPITQVPHIIPSLFNGHFQIVYGFIDYCINASLFAKGSIY